MKISSVAENSQVTVDHPRAIVSRTEASITTSYRFLSASGSLAASSAPTPLTATKAAPRFLSQAMFSVFAPSNSAYHSGMRKKTMPIAMLDQPQILRVSTVLSISLDISHAYSSPLFCCSKQGKWNNHDPSNRTE